MVFSVTICSFGFLLQTFFLTTAKATITGIVFLIIIQIPYFMKMKIKQSGPEAIKFMTISPIFGIGNLITSILWADGSKMQFRFDMLDRNIDGFIGIYFYIFCLIEICVALILGLYMFYVFPVGIGVPAHPLFFIT